MRLMVHACEVCDGEVGFWFETGVLSAPDTPKSSRFPCSEALNEPDDAPRSEPDSNMPIPTRSNGSVSNGFAFSRGELKKFTRRWRGASSDPRVEFRFKMRPALLPSYTDTLPLPSRDDFLANFAGEDENLICLDFDTWVAIPKLNGNPSLVKEVVACFADAQSAHWAIAILGCFGDAMEIVLDDAVLWYLEVVDFADSLISRGHFVPDLVPLDDPHGGQWIAKWSSVLDECDRAVAAEFAERVPASFFTLVRPAVVEPTLMERAAIVRRVCDQHLRAKLRYLTKGTSQRAEAPQEAFSVLCYLDALSGARADASFVDAPYRFLKDLASLRRRFSALLDDHVLALRVSELLVGLDLGAKSGFLVPRDVVGDRSGPHPVAIEFGVVPRRDQSRFYSAAEIWGSGGVAIDAATNVPGDIWLAERLGMLAETFPQFREVMDLPYPRGVILAGGAETEALLAAVAAGVTTVHTLIVDTRNSDAEPEAKIP